MKIKEKIMNLQGTLVHRAATILFCVPFTFSLLACGSSSSDDNSSSSSEVTFQGTVRSELSSDATALESGVNVCALSGCDASNVNGFWRFNVDSSEYSGGSVSFNLNGSVVQGTVTVTELNPSARDITIDFFQRADGVIIVSEVFQEGFFQDPITEDPIVFDPSPLSEDPQQRACQILERSNITISNVTSPIIYRSGDSCPHTFNRAVAVGNIRPIQYEYEVISDSPLLNFSPSTGSVTQDQLNTHDAVYNCGSTEPFLTNVTARVIRYFPSEGEIVTVEEAIERCGNSASIGNTSDTKILTVNVE